MNLVEPEMHWKEAKEKLWRQCSSLGEPGTKEKEKNIQIQIFEFGETV